MEYITLANSDLTVSRLCIGGDPMGGHGWGVVQESDLLEAVQAGIDAGINFFDTADIYGLGRAEELLGKALGGKRKNVIIATKFGVRRNHSNTESYYDNSPKWIRTAIEGSLQRLQTDYIDLYQVHYRDGQTPIADIIGTLDCLQREGKIRYFGLSNIHLQSISERLPYKGKFVSFQNEYSLAKRDLENEIQSISETLDATPMTWGSLGQGILTGKYGPDVKFDKNDRRSRAVYTNFHGEKLKNNLRIVECLSDIGSSYGKTPAETAIRFILDYLPQSAVLVGVKNKKQVLDNCGACNWKLTGADIARLCEVSKWREEA